MKTQELLAAFALLAGCAHARSAEQYRADTEAALAGRSADLKSCYDQVLATKPTAAGRVTVKLAVAAKTGKIEDVQLDPSQTTAPDELSKCVLAAVPAASLQPGDRKRGEATWSWDFTAAPAK